MPWTLIDKTPLTVRLRMTAHEWQGLTWVHDIVFVKPDLKGRQDAAILYITGGEPNPLDLAEAHTLANASGIPVALLFQIPNQPIFDLTEDDLIAHTFFRYLETGDKTWPLLIPMVESAKKALDALQEHKPKIEKFIVTGGSKRGWTAWLLAATGDQRVAGIAPMVFDSLNMAAQLQNQVTIWGAYSEMIEPYTALGLHNAVETPEGQELLKSVDPFTYKEDLTLPKLIINGANDPYWTVDALSLYWHDLKGPSYASIVPNVGHILGDKVQALQAIATFSKSTAANKPLPNINFQWETQALVVESDTSPLAVRLWVAQSEDNRFVDSTWRVSLEVGHGGRKGPFETSLKLPQVSGPMAAFAELEFPDIKLSTPAKII
jgi:PhoPQ-activated pathogenicity-related protein